MADDILIYGDTIASLELRHEIPVAIVDPLLYVERDGRRSVVASVLERERIQAVAPGVEVIDPSELGGDELSEAGMPAGEIELEVAARACTRLGVTDALVPPGFPLAVADRLRAEGVRPVVDAGTFEDRRRAKTRAEIAGIRRAQAVANEAMAAAARMLRESVSDGNGGLTAPDGQPLTCEGVRAHIQDVCSRLGAPAPATIIVAAGPQADGGHEPGSGPIHAGVPVIVDIWPRDEATSCFADMTRTFVVGDVPDEVARQHALVREALARATAAVRAGVPGEEVFGVACDVFEAAGVPTQRTKAPGERLQDGFFHGLGHGVGLGIHEGPSLGKAVSDPLRAGDVVTIEPGCYRKGYGGVRLEDLAIVTEDGAEILTDHPYDLAP
jgi:Xaa-Pro aminopeptidase